MPSRLILPDDVRAQLVAHAQAQAPRECCGLVGGYSTTRRASLVVPMRNAALDLRSYEVEPDEQLAGMNKVYDAGLDLLATYHSHPHSRPYPSSIDVSRAHYPNLAYIIVGLAGPEPEVAAWWIRDGDVEPVT